MQRAHPPNDKHIPHASRSSHAPPLLPMQPRPGPPPRAARRPRHDAGPPIPETLTRWAPPPMFQPLPPNVPMSAPLMGRFVMSSDMPPPPPESAPLLHQPVLLAPPPMGLHGGGAPVFLHAPPPVAQVPAPPMVARPPGPWMSPSLSTSTSTSPSSFIAPALSSTPQTSQSSLRKDDPLGPFALDEDVKPIATSPWLAPPPPLPWL